MFKAGDKVVLDTKELWASLDMYEGWGIYPNTIYEISKITETVGGLMIFIGDIGMPDYDLVPQEIYNSPLYKVLKEA